MRRIEGKTALVTGGASGLGKAIGIRLKSEGAQVVITDIDPNAGKAVAAEQGFAFIEQDVRDEERWGQVVEELESRFQRLDILVNNAGILGPVESANPETTRLQDWRRIFAVNVEGVFLGCRAGIAAMRRAGGGSIVNISSVAGMLATPGAVAYGASKAAVRNLTKSVAQYCCEQKLPVRCNSVHPGDIMTPLWDKAAAEMGRVMNKTPQQVIARELELSPMGDFAKPEDVAAAVAYLASPDARWVTGDGLIVDAGYVNCDSFRPE